MSHPQANTQCILKQNIALKTLFFLARDPRFIATVSLCETKRLEPERLIFLLLFLYFSYDCNRNAVIRNKNRHKY
jgi:hypothetical protein